VFKKRLFISLVVIFFLTALILPAIPVIAAKPIPPPGIQVQLPGSQIPQFVDPLPLLSLVGGPIETILDDGTQQTLTMQEFQANVMPSTFVPAIGTYTGTWVWGYRAGISPTNPAGTYIGPVIIATRSQPTNVNFVNDLGTTTTTNILAYKNATDQSLHWANPDNAPMMIANPFPPPAMVGNPIHYDGPIPAVTHLHGGEVPPVLDGGPDAWFTSDGAKRGAAYYTSGTPGNSSIYRYPNSQEAAPLWFHDHTLGATRLNVYMGLAGAYLLTDPGLTLPAGLSATGLSRTTANPPDDTIVPMVIQDRMFDANGQLFLPNVGINPEHPYWMPEFLGDTIVVNGKVWPYLNVKAQRYRFLLINGSNARTYEMSFQVQGKGKPPTIWQIGTDGGYLDTPVAVPKLILMPGERADVIVDFAGLAPGTKLILENTAKAPYPAGSPPQGSTVGKIMQFRIVAGAVAPDDSYNPATGIPIRSGGQSIVRLVTPTTGTLSAGVTIYKKRQLTLNEVMGMKAKVGGVQFPGGPLEILVNNTKWAGVNPDGTIRSDFTLNPLTGNYLSEMPAEGTTEQWEFINLTADTHPIHLHLVQFQLLNRQAIDVKGYSAVYNAAFKGGGIDPMTSLPYPAGVYMPGYGPPDNYNTLNASGAVGGNPDPTPFLIGTALPPNPNEAGWKDTIMVPPGMVTRIIVRWAPTDIAVGGTGGDPATLRYPFDPNAGGAEYVWHCHIVDHEDNEMMRPDTVIPKPGVTRSYIYGTDY